MRNAATITNAFGTGAWRAATMLAAVLLASVLLSSCATTGGSSSPPVDDAGARALADQGEFHAAAAAYEQLARKNRGRRDELLLLAAENLREEEDFDAIDALVVEIRRKRLNAAQSTRLDLLLAESALARGDAARALDLATVASVPALRSRAAEIRARALEATGRPLDAVTERIAMLESADPADRAGVEADLLAALGRVEPAQINQALSTLPPADARRPWLERALRSRGGVPVRNIPRPTRQVGTLLPGEDGDAPWKREGFQASPRVALLVPLTGSLAAAGVAVRDGFLAGYLSDGEQRPQVRIFDTGETVEGAIDAYQRAVEDGSVRAIGPLTREQVAAVLGQVDPRVPVLALNHPDSGAAPPPGSQQFGLLPDDEGALIADAALARGLRRAAIFAGTDEWSERAALAFRAQFEQGGGFVAGEARIVAEQVDYAPQISRASAGGADVVFLSVRAQQGRLLVPQLRASGHAQTPLLATSAIFSGTVSRALDRDLDGVEFVDSPWLYGAVGGLPARETLHKLPAVTAAPRLFAFGIDAYRLLPYLDWLSRNEDAYLDGASGQLTVDSFGRVRRVPSWQRFMDGTPHPADGALRPDASPLESLPPQ